MKCRICKLSELKKGDFANIFSVKGSQTFNNLMFAKGVLPGARFFVAEKSNNGELLIKHNNLKVLIVEKDAQNIIILKSI